MPLFAAPADGLEDPNRRAKMMLLVLGVVVVIAAVFLFVIKPMLNKSDGSASGDVPTPVVSGAPDGGATVPSVPTPSAALSPSPAPSFAVNGSTRDPFAEIAVQIAASASATPTDNPLPSVTADPNPSPSPSDTPTDNPTPSDTPTSTPTSTPTQSPAPSATSHTLVLLTVTGTTATLTVDGADVQGSAGDTLGGGVVLMKVTQDAVFVTYDSQAYAIAIGQTVTVDGTPAGRG